MSFNFDKVGKKICEIKNNVRYKTKNKVYVCNEAFEGDEKIKDFSDLEIQSGEFQLSPSKDMERVTMYITSPSGGGKSYFASQYIQEYHKVLPKNEIYLVSEQDVDPAFDKLDYIKRIIIDDLDKDPLHYREFENCLVLFDDTDSIRGKLGKAVDALRDKLLKNSRKFKVSVITTNHSCCGQDIKAVLNESEIIVFFMMSYNRSLKYLLENYIGLNKKTIDKLKTNSSKSRWTAYIKGYPCVLIQQKFITTVSKLEELN
jgi:hypothetical protein